jgi:RNA polymerase sigma-70 factor (ECF subfamily)
MVGDRDRAADIAQDTFIKAFRKFVVRMDDPSDDERRPTEQPDHRPGPEQQVLSSQLDERIQRALLKLRPNHRQCLLLSDLEDMSGQQIGEVMGLSYGAVRTLLCRARGEMRRHLAAEGLDR